MKYSSNIWECLPFVPISPPMGDPLFFLVATRPASTIEKKKKKKTLAWVSWVAGPYKVDQFAFMTKTHLSFWLVVTNTYNVNMQNIYFGRNRAQGHIRVWALFRMWLTWWHTFSIPDLIVETTLKLPITLFRWRWYRQGYHICFQRMWGWQTF